MGEVYLAQDNQLDRKVALKILSAEVSADRSRMNRFILEAKAASALNHPNIITIHEINQSESGLYIATEFIEGETVRARMRSGSMPLVEVLDIATQVASALTAAHAVGIIHRDIKPDNVMIRTDSFVKLLDFGLAKLTERVSREIVDTEAPTYAVVTTDPGVVMGTASYMSPEQARGLSLDARTDIFSLGVLIYEMVAGRLPFEGSNTNEIVASILSDKEVQPLARYSTEAPAELDRIIYKCLRKDREERYQTTKDLLLDLRRLKEELEFERRLERSNPPGPPGVDGGKVSKAAENFATNTSHNTSHPATVPLTSNLITRYRTSALIIVAALVLSTLVIGYWFLRHRPAENSTAIDSIAVLPFENVTHDQNTEYFSDGVTESLINSLSQLPNVKVIARGSVFRYKNQTPDLQQVAKQLNVKAILTGRVLAQGDTLGVSVELMDAQNNTQLWGQHYTKKAADIFAVQEEIARQVTDTLRVRLTGGQQEQVTKHYTENAEAYRLYLQGRHFMNEFSEENLSRAIPFFDQAITLDPRYALAYAARGETYFAMGDLSLNMSDAKLKVRQDIAAALALDPKLVEARTTQANLKFQYDWDFAGAEQDFRQAIALNPNFAEAHHDYGWYLAMIGKEMDSVAEMKTAEQLDPVNPDISVDVCLPYLFARQYDQVSVQARKVLEMYPNFYIAHMVLGTALFLKGEHSAGVEEVQKAKTLEPTPHLLGLSGFVYGRTGRKDEARKLLDELKAQSKTRYVAPYWIGMVYVGLDEKDEAFAWFEKAYKERSWWLMFLKMDPLTDSLRSDPRFNDLILRIGYPQ